MIFITIDYGKADFALISNDLYFFNRFLINFCVRSVMKNWSLLKNKLQSVTNTDIPLRILSSNENFKWFQTKLKRFTNKKDVYYLSRNFKTTALI